MEKSKKKPNSVFNLELFYNILSSLLKKPILVGVAYEFQKQNQIQPNPWDIPLDMIFTESKIYHSDIDRDVSE